MENYDDDVPNLETCEWVNDDGDCADIDEKNGEWYWRGKITPDHFNKGRFFIGKDLEIDIMSLSFTVPKSIKGGPYDEQNIVGILNAKDWYEKCPVCEIKILDDGLVLMLEIFHIYPAKCCNNMIWIRNGEGMIWENLV